MTSRRASFCLSKSRNLLGPLLWWDETQPAIAVELKRNAIVQVARSVIQSARLDDDIPGHGFQPIVQAGAAVGTEEVPVPLSALSKGVIKFGLTWN